MEFMVFLSEQWLLVSVLATLVTALVVVESKRAGPSLSLHQVTRMVNDGSAVIVDVRDAAEYKAGHIVDALNIPYAKLKERGEELKKHQNKTLIVVDKLGQHAGAASKMLRELGFTVNRMQGGMSEWQSQNLPLIKG